LVSPLITLFPIYVEKVLGESPRLSGDVRMLFVAFGGLVALPGGAICDVLGRKPAYLLAMSGVVAGGCLFLTRDPAVLYGLAVFGGLMFGLGAVAGQSYLMDSVPQRSLAIATAAYFLTGTVGNAAGAFQFAWLAANTESTYADIGKLVLLGETVLVGAAALWLPGLPRPATARTVAGFAGGYAGLFRQTSVLALLALRFLPTFYWGCVTFLLNLLLFRLTGDEKLAGTYTAISSLLAAGCQLGTGRLVDRIGPHRPVLTAITLVTVAALGQGLFAQSAAGLVLFGLLGAGAAWSLSITMTTLIQALSTEKTKGSLLGVTHAFWSAGFLTGTGLGSRAATWDDPGRTAFLLCGSGCALAILCAWLVIRGIPRKVTTG
ncbi:MAG: MFS transporter, partial [Armatimonadetes bacterium]|nr:MFS transporter [Armatimonadota bacterium]